MNWYNWRRMKFLRFAQEHFRRLFEKLGKFRPKHALFTPWFLWGLPIFFLAIIIYNLAASQSVLEKIKEQETLKNQSVEIQKQILAWQKIVDVNPDFRDGYLQLAILNTKLYRDFAAKKYLEKVLEIDPNNETAKRLLSSLPAAPP